MVHHGRDPETWSTLKTNLLHRMVSGIEKSTDRERVPSLESCLRWRSSLRGTSETDMFGGIRKTWYMSIKKDLDRESLR